MKYLKKFETQAAYEAAESNLILPNVSLISETNAVAYKPSVPPVPSHDYVEIGDVKWATMNVGANSITDTGLYFEWGNPQGYSVDQIGCEKGKKCFADGCGDYKWYDDGGETFTKYNSTDGLITLESSDDAVTAAWGGNWRMPTATEFAALGTATTSAWTSSYEGSGVAGLVLTSKTNDATLFFPAYGSARNGSVRSVGGYGYYWSSSLTLDSEGQFVDYAYYLYFYNGDVSWNNSINRCRGYAVRGVLAEN